MLTAERSAFLAAPESYEELKSLLSAKTMEEQLAVVERIQTCNHPSLAVGNKAKLEVRAARRGCQGGPHPVCVARGMCLGPLWLRVLCVDPVTARRRRCCPPLAGGGRPRPRLPGPQAGAPALRLRRPALGTCLFFSASVARSRTRRRDGRVLGLSGVLGAGCCPAGAHASWCRASSWACPLQGAPVRGPEAHVHTC